MWPLPLLGAGEKIEEDVAASAAAATAWSSWGGDRSMIHRVVSRVKVIRSWDQTRNPDFEFCGPS